MFGWAEDQTEYILQVFKEKNKTQFRSCCKTDQEFAAVTQNQLLLLEVGHRNELIEYRNTKNIIIIMITITMIIMNIIIIIIIIMIIRYVNSAR